ncbi:MAG TPA: DNA translocase FtsK 4TM domain-containing protein, partial [Agriterribacter sp.]|nr:DNA translocase FtsK 4TM domain-containing protein [Agriterribacter sp.]
MANKLKNNKSKSPDPEKLTGDRTEKVKVKELVKDERTHKILGSVLLLTAFFLFIAFTSYLFTWRQDQDKVFQGFSAFLFGEDIKAANLLGRIGAYISHIFFYKGFGLSSYLFCSFFFITGVNLLFGERVFSPWRNFRYVVVGLVFFSTALAFITHGSGFPWGGETGNITSSWLRGLLGEIGTAALLLAGGFAYFIWRFNPSFSLPAKRSKYEKGNGKLVPVDNSFTEEARLFTEENITKDAKGNTLKHHGGVVVINPPGADQPEDPYLPSETAAEPVMPKTTVISKPGKKTTGELELQINTMNEAEDNTGDVLPPEESAPVKKVQNLPPYDPVLD